MLNKTKIFLVNFLIYLTIFVSGKLLDSSALLSRHRRFLIYEPGINWVQMVGGIGLPYEIKDHSVTLGVAVKSYYRLPNNSSQILSPSLFYSSRKKRSLSRWHFYNTIQNFMERHGIKNAKICILHTICHTSYLPFDPKTGLLSEIMHILFTPSSTKEDVMSNGDFEYHAAEKYGRDQNDCDAIFPGCDVNLIEQFTRML